VPSKLINLENARNGSDPAGNAHQPQPGEANRNGAPATTGTDPYSDDAMTTAANDLELASAEDVLAYAVERFHPRLTLACSFQKEESVLVHMLTQIEPDARVFVIDTGVLFPETYETWRRFEEHFGMRVEVFDAVSPDEPWTAER
jgi:3'-phosphoadenosine 5'-phosphosulfate sulfotransferase (PAPS reductase)/FAD synthetase